jgi:hypothetical protein
MSSHITNHAKVRMQQRGKRTADVGFLLQHGIHVDGGVFLSERAAAEIIETARHEIAHAEKLRGVFLPMVSGNIKSIFKASRKHQSRLM